MKRKFTIRAVVLGLFLGVLNFLVLNTAYAGSGGPDTYGYTYSDSNGGSATYSWISHTGGATTVGGRGDDTLYGPYNVGFTFNFYGTDYTQFYICNNGFVTFSSGNCAWTELTIPTSGAPDNFIAPFWDDLYTAGTIKYELFGTTPNQYMVISYEQIDHISASGGADFQVIIYETSNKIQLQYGDVTFGGAPNDSGASAAVGIENSGGTDGLQFSYQSASLSANLAIEFTWPTPSLTVTQSAYRFFQNANSTDVGTALAAADSIAVLNATRQQFRLRMLLHIGGTTVSQSAGSYKLQYIGKGSGTCASPSSGTPSSWTDVSTATDIAFYDNATPTDASALTSNGSDPTHSGHTVVNQNYEEANNFSNSQALIAAGQDGKWDFALYDKTAAASTTYCFRIVNSTDAVLDTYTVYPELTTKATSGGPDTYGYRWSDSNGFGEAYSWTDISGTGTEITGRSDDSMSTFKPIGFTFSFYGNSYTNFYVCNNGFISFSNDTCAYVNATIITAGTPNDFIAPFWDDMYTGGHIYYQTTGTTPNQKLIVSFDGINPYSTQASALSFQVVLHETSGMIELQYNDVDYGTTGYGGGLGATVGIENSSGSDGLLYSFEQANLSNSYAITFSASSPYNQSAYRLFANSNGTGVGTALAAQDTAYTLTSDGDAFRLRMLLHNSGSLLGSSGENFKLQYVDKGAGTCASPSGTSPASWTDITASTDLAYKDNATPTDGSALTTDSGDPTHSGHTRNYQTYEELNNFTNSQSTIPASEDAMWDFALYDKSVSGVSTFCIKAVKSSGIGFSTYTSYPQITTAAAASSITFSLSTNSISFGSLTSTASTAATPATVSVTSNAANGFQVYIKGEGNGATAGLYNGSYSSLVSAAASTSVTTSGTPGFGVYAENASAGITIDEGFDNDSASDLAISRSYQKVFSTTAAGGGAQTADLRYKAVVDSLTTAGSYTENIDVIAFGSF